MRSGLVTDFFIQWRKAAFLAAVFWSLRVAEGFLVLFGTGHSKWVLRLATIAFAGCLVVVLRRRREVPKWAGLTAYLALIGLVVSVAIRIAGGTVDFAPLAYATLGVWFFAASRPVRAVISWAGMVTGAALILVGVGMTVAQAEVLAGQIVAWSAYAMSAAAMIWWAQSKPTARTVLDPVVAT